MSRVKRGVAAHKKHKKLLSQAEGRRASKHKLVRPAREAAMHALRYAYRDRRARKGQFRALWIARINAAARDAGGWYSRLMATLRPSVLLKKKGTRVVPRRPAFVPNERRALCFPGAGPQGVGAPGRGADREAGGEGERGRRRPEGAREPRGRRDRRRRGRGRPR